MRSSAFAALSIAGVLTFAAAQTRSSLNGSWYMDKSRSQYPAESATEVIEERGNTIDIVLTENLPGRQSTPMPLHLRTDGEPAISTVGSNKFTSTTHWENDKLVTFVQGDRGQHMTEVRQLSPDGNTLTVTGYHQDELTKPYYVRVMTRKKL